MWGGACEGERSRLGWSSLAILCRGSVCCRLRVPVFREYAVCHTALETRTASGHAQCVCRERRWRVGSDWCGGGEGEGGSVVGAEDGA